MELKDFEGKIPEEIMNELLKQPAEELDLESLETACGGRVIGNILELEKVINGGDMDKIREFDARMLDSLAKNRNWDEFSRLAKEKDAFVKELFKKYSSGVVVPTPDGDIIHPF